MDFAKLKPALNNYFPDTLDGTPEGFALRILKQARQQCDRKFEKVEGCSTEEMIFRQMVNQIQNARAKDLDKAIALLETLVPAEEILNG